MEKVPISQCWGIKIQNSICNENNNNNNKKTAVMIGFLGLLADKIQLNSLKKMLAVHFGLFLFHGSSSSF